MKEVYRCLQVRQGCGADKGEVAEGPFPCVRHLFASRHPGNHQSLPIFTLVVGLIVPHRGTVSSSRPIVHGEVSYLYLSSSRISSLFYLP